MRRALAVAAVSLLALTGCSEADTDPGTTETAAETPTVEPSTPGPSQSETPTPTEEPTEDDAIEIEIEGDRIEPNGKLVEAQAGEPIVLEIESDRAGEFHVHSSPEQVIGFDKGESRVELTIDRPGVVDVEEHETGIVVLQLEVS